MKDTCSENRKREKEEMESIIMKRRLIIDGNAVYELDEDCMLKKRLDRDEKAKEKMEEKKECVAKSSNQMIE